MCFLALEDQSVAQQVERLRNNGGVRVTGTGFYKLGPVNRNTVTLLPVAAQVSLGDSRGGTVHSTTVWGPERAAE